MDMFGSKSKPGKKGQDSLDDLLGDLLEPEETPKKKPAQGRGRAAGKSGGKDDFYSNLAAMAENDVESDISDADVGKMAKCIAGLDDMDADLFGDTLSVKKKGSIKGNSKGSKNITPRSNSVTPRSAAERVASPTRSETPTSPPSSARGSLKRKPVKPSSSTPSPTVSTYPPGTAPGKMTDLGRASENLKPGQLNKEDKRPGTVPRVKKFDFGDFDEDDPLAGLSLDEDSISEAGKKQAAKKAPLKEQKSLEDEAKVAPSAAQPSSPRKPNLFDRPPTRSGSGNASAETTAEPPPPPKPAEPAPKRKDEMIFSDDDNFLDGLGIDADDKKKSAAAAATPAPAAKANSAAGDSEDNRPAKSVLDGLLGRGQKTASSLLETKEKPRTFVLDKKYTQPKEEKQEDEDDFLFGSYQPSAAASSAGNSRPGSRRSVRFQDDDDIFGLDKPLGQRPTSSGSVGARSVPDDMKWLEELTGGGGGDSTPSSNKSLVGSATPSSPAKAPAVAQPSSPVKSSPAPKPTDKMADFSFGRSAASDTSKVGDGMSAKDSLLNSLVKNSPREVSPERKAEVPKPSAKLDAKDWLGLKDSDSDGELFIPKRVSSRSPGVTDTTPRTPTSSRPTRGAAKSASPTKELGGQKSDDDDDDSFIARAKARRMAAMGNQAKDKTPAVASTGAVDPAALLAAPESPRFEGSMPAAVQQGGQEARDLFAFPPARAASTPKFETAPGRNASAAMPVSPRDDRDSIYKKEPADLGQPQSVSMTTGVGGEGMGRTLQSRRFEQKHEESRPGSRYDRFSGLGGPSVDSPEEQLRKLQQEQQLQQQQQLQQHLEQQQQLQQQQAASIAAQTSSLSFGPGASYLPQGTSLTGGTPSVSGTYLNAGAIQGPIPASLQDAIAQLRKVEIEKQYSDSLVESTRKRYEEEIMAIEKSYRNQLQILEESNQKSEQRLRAEVERLMEEHLAKVKRMEQEKADLAAESFRRLEEQERLFAQEMEKLKEKQRQAVLDLKKEHEEAQQLLLEAKNKEIQKVASSHDTSRSLTAAVEQIENNARDLGQLQLKLDEWKRSGLDDREIAMRAKDEQLTMLQARLTKQEEDNERERHRLEDLIARMESQNRDQLRQLEEERWKLKQEQSRVEAQQSVMENERRMWAEQQARERQSLDRARDMFLEEQQSGLSHLTDERRNLAEERSKLNLEQKLLREKMQQDAVRTAQSQAEYDVVMKTISEEKARAAERMRELRQEEERISAERDRFHERTAALEQEKQRLEKLALNVKQRSEELDAISEEANRARVSGERALAEARMLHSQLDQRQAELEAQQASVKAAEEHIAQEKLRLAKEKKDVENLKQAGLCFNCRNMLQGGANHVVHTAGAVLAGTPLAANPLAGTPLQPSPQGVTGMTMSSITYETVASSIASDRAVRMWKIQAIKDKEYLEEESMFLEGLKHSPYH